MKENKKIKSNNFKKFGGFTLMEILIAIGLIVILAGTIMISINPQQKFSEARDDQREIHLNSIWHAMEQKMHRNRGQWDCPDIPSEETLIAAGSDQDEYDLYDCIYPDYLSEPLYDPQNGEFSNETDYNTGYYLAMDHRGNIYLKAEGENENIIIGELPDFAVLTHQASSVGETSATLEGELANLGEASDGDVQFEYADDENLDNSTLTTEENLTNTETFSKEITDLDSEKNYYFRALGESSEGDTSKGQINEFTTDSGTETYSLTVDSSSGGSGTDVTDSSPYEEEATVDIEATPDSGYEFEEWTTDDGGSFGDSTSTDTTYDMPSEDATITANFAEEIAFCEDSADYGTEGEIDGDVVWCDDDGNLWSPTLSGMGDASDGTVDEFEWGCDETEIGANSDTDGISNTNTILDEDCKDEDDGENVAAKACNQLAWAGSEEGDWYLPARYEYEPFVNSVNTSTDGSCPTGWSWEDGDTNDFDNCEPDYDYNAESDDYLSSTETDSEDATNVNFELGNVGDTFKSFSDPVRCVRR